MAQGPQPRCVGCGAVLGSADLACPECKAPARGARFDEPRTLPMFRDVEMPKACCCCLAEPTTRSRDQVYGQGLDFEFDVPWCDGCRWRNRAVVYGAAAAGIAGILVLFALAAESRPGPVGFLLLAALGFGVPFLLVVKLLPRVLPGLRLRGHVLGCDAYGAGSVLQAEGTDKLFGSVVFRNRAFAKMYERLNP